MNNDILAGIKHVELNHVYLLLNSAHGLLKYNNMMVIRTIYIEKY
jgi:hypothetical protein